MRVLLQAKIIKIRALRILNKSIYNHANLHPSSAKGLGEMPKEGI